MPMTGHPVLFNAAALMRSMSWWDPCHDEIDSIWYCSGNVFPACIIWPMGYTNIFYSSWTHSSTPLFSDTRNLVPEQIWFLVLVLCLGSWTWSWSKTLGHGWVVTEWMVTVSLWAQSIKGRLSVATCQHIPQGQWILRRFLVLRVLHCIVCPCRSLLFFSLSSFACLQETWCH